METVRVDKFTLVKLDDRGQYGFSLMEGWEKKDGTFSPSFCKREVGKEKTERTLPVSVKLGDRGTAIGVLRTLLAELEG